MAISRQDVEALLEGMRAQGRTSCGGDLTLTPEDAYLVTIGHQRLTGWPKPAAAQPNLDPGFLRRQQQVELGEMGGAETPVASCPAPQGTQSDPQDRAAYVPPSFAMGIAGGSVATQKSEEPQVLLESAPALIVGAQAWQAIQHPKPAISLSRLIELGRERLAARELYPQPTPALPPELAGVTGRVEGVYRVPDPQPTPPNSSGGTGFFVRPEKSDLQLLSDEVRKLAAALVRLAERG